MKCYVACVLVLFTLDLTGCADVKWEVLNDVTTADDDKATQQELLTRDELIPYVKPKPKPKAVVIKEYMDKKAEKDKAAAAVPGSHAAAAKKAIPAPVLLTAGKRAPGRGDEERGREDFRGEDLLPLGVPHTNKRHLLQLPPPVQGPQLPAAVETQRLREKSLFDNLSQPCRDAVDEDCLFDIDSLVNKKESKGFMDKAPQVKKSEEPHTSVQSHPRRRRQADTNTQSDSGTNTQSDTESSDNTDEGSGTSMSDELYTSQASYVEEGNYEISSTIVLDVGNLTDSQVEQLLPEIIAELEKIFNSTIPGFDGFNTSVPLLINGSLIITAVININASKASSEASEAGETNLEDFIFNSLNNSLIPALNNLNISGYTISDENKLSSGDVDALITILYNYCNSPNPCPDAGPEYDVTACVSNGFLSGYCPHKCSSYPCQSDAECMLDANYDPYCNCGELYTGQYCNETLAADEGLGTGETVGVVAAGVVIAACAVGCCCYLVIFWKRSNEVNYTYYQDEGVEEQASDPTCYNYYIDRPIISGSLHVFHLGQDGATA